MRTKLGKLQRIQIENAIRDSWMNGYHKGKIDGAYFFSNTIIDNIKKEYSDHQSKCQARAKQWPGGNDSVVANALCDKLDKFLTPRVTK